MIIIIIENNNHYYYYYELDILNFDIVYLDKKMDKKIKYIDWVYIFTYYYLYFVKLLKFSKRLLTFDIRTPKLKIQIELFS